MHFRFTGFLVACLLSTVAIAQVSLLKETKSRVGKSGRWAICIGASQYQSLGELGFAAKDAGDVAKKLVQRFDFSSDQVRLLSDLQAADQKPTAQNIKTEIQKVLQDPRIEKGDLFVFYFSGHGIGTAKGDFLCPTDATKENADSVGLPVKWVVDAFTKAGLKNVLFIADACRSGKENRFGTELKLLGERTNFAMFLGCKPGGRSYEYPDLGHGAFTYFLLKGLDDEGLYESGTGVLWASELAKKVASRVGAYTAKDYGDDKQVPDVWTKKSTDVLLDVNVLQNDSLGSFLTDVLEGKTLSVDNIKKRFGIDRNSEMGIPFFLGAFIEFCISEKAYEAAIKTIRVKETLGSSTSADLYNLATCASQLDQADLFEQATARLAKLDVKGYYRDRALLLNPRGATPGPKLVEAARRIFSTEPTFDNAYNTTTLASNYNLPKTEQAELARFFRDQFGPTTRPGAFFEAVALIAERKGLEAFNAVDKAQQIRTTASLKDEIPSFYDFLRLDYEALLQFGTKEQRLRLVRLGLKSKVEAPFWQRIYDLEAENAESVMADLPNMIKRASSPDDLLTVVQLAGSQAPKLAPLLKEVTNERFASSWSAHLAVWIADQKNDFGAPFKFSEDLQKHMPRDVVFKPKFAYTLSRVLKRLKREGLISEIRMESVSSALLNDMIPLAPFLADSVDYWNTLQTVSRNAGRAAQAHVVAQRHLVKRVLSDAGEPSLAGIAIEFVIDAGDLDTAKTLLTRYGGKTIDSEAMLIVAANLAVLGELDSVNKIMEALPKTASPMTKELRGALFGYIAALIRKPDEAAKWLALTKDSTDILVHQLAGLARFTLGEKEKAVMALSDEMGDFDYRAHHVHAKVLEVLIDSIKRKDQAAADFCDRLVMIVADRGYFPAYHRLYFGPSATVASFAGTQTFTGHFVDEVRNVDRDSQFTIDLKPSGQGTLTIKGKPDLVIKGRIDDFGSFTASWKDERGVENQLYFKVMPVGLRDRNKRIAEYVQHVWILDENGTMSYFEEILK